jgi:para-nitrobenzyl esterase
MIRYYFNLVFLLLTLRLLAQDHSTCNTQRYRLDVFDNVKVTKDIKFADEITIAGNAQELYMDVYEPEDDAAVNRPVVVLGFGGSFVTGSRRDIAPICEMFAKKGYVAVTIDYRIYDLPLIPIPTKEEMQDVVVRAIKDLKSALRYLDNDAKAENSYRIDMSWLYVGGISSGGIAAIHAAMLDSTDVYSPEIASAIAMHAPIYGITDTDTSIKIRGVLNYSGALHDVAWLDSGDPPFISFHDVGDPTVPYKGGYAQVLAQDIIYLDGSFVMDSAAKANSVFSILNTIESNTHVSYFRNAEKAMEVVDASALFMYDMICSETADVADIAVSKPYTFGPNPTAGSLGIEVKGDAVASLYDLTGRLLSTQTVTRAGMLNLHEYAPGSYLLKIRIGDAVHTEKIMRE